MLTDVDSSCSEDVEIEHIKISIDFKLKKRKKVWAVIFINQGYIYVAPV